MKRILQRGRHFFSSKGRHGTHSPFVYAYVEHVLRNKGKRKVGHGYGMLTRMQCNYILRTVHYLNAAIIYTDDVLMPSMQLLFAGSDIVVAPLHFGDIKGEQTYNIVIQEAEPLLNYIGNNPSPIYNVIVPLHRKNAAQAGLQQRLKQNALFKMVLETWHIMFLSNNPDFKIKQYFKLR